MKVYFMRINEIANWRTFGGHYEFTLRVRKINSQNSGNRTGIFSTTIEIFWNRMEKFSWNFLLTFSKYFQEARENGF